MQRPKQQALAFLLGAVLVGGVVGFSADRVMRKPDATLAERRAALYDDLKLEPAQRVKMDSLLDDRNCRYEALFATMQPTLDSVKAATRQQMDLLMTPDQRTRLEARRREMDAKKIAERKRMEASCRR